MISAQSKQTIGVLLLCFVALPMSHILGYWYGELLNASLHYQPITWHMFWSLYTEQVQQLYAGVALFPGTNTPLIEAIQTAFVRSAGLFLCAAGVASIAGIWTANAVVRFQHTLRMRWFASVISVTSTLPALFFASGAIAAMYYVIVYTPYDLPIPLQGFGWDWHLLLPLLALSIRAWCGVVLSCSESLREELSKPHIMAVRAKGIPEAQIIVHHVWPAQQRAIGLKITGQFRIMLAELIIVEYLFKWQGIGQLFAECIMSPSQSNIAASALYASSPVIAASITGFVLLFCIVECMRQLWRPNYETHISAQESI